MKNPLELTMLEIEALMREDADAPQYEFTRLLRWIHDRQQYLKEYQVQRETELHKALRSESVSESRLAKQMGRRKASSMDAELLDSAEIVEFNESQCATFDKYDKIIGRT